LDVTEPHRNVLLDTGPLVAIFCEEDEHHQVCVEALRATVPPLLTTWPVLTEAAWMLRDEPMALRRLYAPQGLFTMVPQGDHELAECKAIFERYHSLSPQLADLSLVQLAESRGLSTVFTLDRRDFTVYRAKRKRLTLLPEI
jgi:predicted nucleic acid-binding protein